MAESTKDSVLFQREGKPPAGELLPLALQHVVAAVVGIITPAIIVANTCGLTADEKTMLIQVSLVMAGLITLVQAHPLFNGKIGSGLPIIMGASFAYVPTLTSIGGSFGIGAIIGAELIGGLVAGYKPNEIAAMFTKYGKEMFTAALVLGMAKAVSLVLTQGNIIDTMVYGMSSILGGLPAGLSAVIMFLIQTIVNFFINSGSGQAATMMPIMAPLSDLIGVSRQTAILAFQMGDGLSNMIWPTSASMMAYVFAANEKFESYLKFVLPIFLIVSVLGAIMLVIGTAIGY